MGKPTKIPRTTEKEEKEKFKPPLIPEGDPSDDPNGKKQSMLSKYSPVIMPILFALVVSFFLINVMAVSKGTYNNAVAGLSGRIGAVETTIATVTGMPKTVAAQIQAIEESMATFQPDVDGIDNLAVEINDLQAQVADLNIPSESSLTDVIDSSMAGLKSNLQALEVKLTALEWRLDDLEAEIDAPDGDEDDPVVTDEEVRWYTQIYSVNYGESTIEIDLGEVRISPNRIEEADDYSLTIPLINNTEEEIKDVIISIVFTPRTGSRVRVNEDDIYLDSVYSPFTIWAMDIVERSDGTVRRIRFTSENIRIEGGSGDPFEPGELDLRLEFTLAYE